MCFHLRKGVRFLGDCRFIFRWIVLIPPSRACISYDGKFLVREYGMQTNSKNEIVYSMQVADDMQTRNAPRHYAHSNTTMCFLLP